MLAATSGLPGRRRDFLVQCQTKARRCQRRTVSGRTISRHRRQPDQHRYNTTHKSRSQRWRRKRRGAFFWQTASWWRSARISACRAARVRKLEATKAKRATKRELIVVATMISVRRAKALIRSGVNPPGNWFAPPGSNQSSSGGNETAEASGAEGRVGDLASL